MSVQSLIHHANAIDLVKLIPDNSVDLIIIDPPYLTTTEKWDKIEAVNPDLVKELHRVLTLTGNLYCWCGIGEKSQSLIRWFPLFKEYLHFKDLITWKKKRGIGMRKGWLYTREECMWFVKDNSQFYWDKDEQYSTEPNQFKKGMSGTVVQPFKRLTNVWTDIDEKLVKDYPVNHYTPKQEELIERLVKVSSPAKGWVLDCFLGSGTTAAVCQKLSRNFIGCDNNMEFVQMAMDRIYLS